MKTSAHESTPPAEAARAFRDRHGLGIAPLADLVALIEQTQSAEVAVLPARDDEHGMTMVDPQRGSTIVAVATSEHPMRWRSTLAHELGHLVFGDHNTGSPNTLHTDRAIEDRAQTFARHLLLPPEAMQRALTTTAGPSQEALSEIVQRFAASPPMVSRQLLDLALIDGETHQAWKSIYTPQLAARFGWAEHYQSLQAESRQRRSPQRLLTRAIAGYIAGVVAVETLASLRGIDVLDMERELRDAQIQPAAAGADSTGLDDVEPRSEFLDLSWLDDEAKDDIDPADHDFDPASQNRAELDSGDDLSPRRQTGRTSDA